MRGFVATRLYDSARSLSARELTRPKTCYTRTRRALVETLRRAGRPQSFPELLHQERDLAQSSAYRNLGILEQAELVHRIVTGDDFARFELAQELTEHNHHHRICSSCGLLEHFTLPGRREEQLEEALRQVASTSAFTPALHQLDLFGRCRGCA